MAKPIIRTFAQSAASDTPSGNVKNQQKPPGRAEKGFWTEQYVCGAAVAITAAYLLKSARVIMSGNRWVNLKENKKHSE